MKGDEEAINQLFMLRRDGVLHSSSFNEYLLCTLYSEMRLVVSSNTHLPPYALFPDEKMGNK